MAPPKPKKPRLDRLLVTGGRDYTDRETLYRVLDTHLKTIEFLIHGACPTGADKLADEWAAERYVQVVKYPAQWELYGLAAGPHRNAYMIGEQEPTAAVTFPGGKGTADCVRRLKAHGIDIEFVS